MLDISPRPNSRALMAIVLGMGILLANPLGGKVILDGRDPKPRVPVNLSPETQEGLVRQIFSEAPSDAVLRINGVQSGFFDHRNIMQTLILCRWEGSPNIGPNEIVEWRAGVFYEGKLLRRFEIPTAFGGHFETRIDHLLDIDGDGIDEVIATDGVHGWVLQTRGNRLEVRLSHPIFMDPFSPVWREGAIDPPPARVVSAWRVTFNGKLPISRRSFSVIAFQRKIDASGNSESWIPIRNQSHGVVR